jgi:hypothetical protein
MTVCAAPIKGTHLRLIKVNSCGTPVTGASSAVIVSKSFVQVAMEPVYEDGEEIIQKTADGSLCVNEVGDDTLKRFNLTIDLCSVDPELVAYALGGRLLSVGSPLVTGAGFAVPEGTPTGHFSLEVWQEVAGVAACDESGDVNYIYNAWPHVGAGRLGTYTIQNGVTQLQLQVKTHAPSLLWGTGPGTGTSWITPAAVESLDHWLWAVTSTAPPTEACGSTLLT